MERKGLFKLPYQILIYEIPKYLSLKDYINYTSTCKYLNDNLEYSDIWKKSLNSYFTKEEIKLAENEETAYNKFKLLVNQTVNYKNCSIAHRDTCWTEKEDSISLNSVCWFHIIGKFDHILDGRYVPEFRVKFNRRSIGLDRLEFNANVFEVEIDPNEKKQKEEEQKEKEPNELEEEEQDPAEETQHRDGEESNDENTVSTVSHSNNSNNRTSIFESVFRIFTVNRSNTNSKSITNDTNNNEQKKELATRLIRMTQNKFNRNTLKIYKNGEWRVVECPEIIVDHSSIDPTKSRLRIEMEIKDLNGYWKSGFSFKGMYLRKVVLSDSSSDIRNSDSDME